MDAVNIQIRFKKVSSEGMEFNDALYFTPEEYAAKTPAEIEAMKQARFDNWIAHIAAQRLVVPPPVTVEDVAQGLSDFRSAAASQLDQLVAMATEVAPEIVPPLEAMRAGATAVLDGVDAAVGARV